MVGRRFDPCWENSDFFFQAACVTLNEHLFLSDIKILLFFCLGSSLCTDAVSLVKDIIGIMDAFLDVNKSQYSGKDTLATVIKKIRKEVSLPLKVLIKLSL